MIFRSITTLLLLFSVTACSNLAYYSQAVLGQMDLLSARRDFNTVYADESVSEEVKAKIKLAEEILAFAEFDIGLPVEDTFSTYADIERPFVVWNVFAAKPYSIDLETFCFPIAGCVAYKGFFSKADASAFSQALENNGFETYMGGVAAYSTLGWFSDPLLNTFILRSEASLAALIFHELAHKILYVKDDTVFNESFAVTVERYALEQWLASRNQSQRYNQYVQSQERQGSVIELILKSRVTLSEIYEMEESEERSRKKEEVIQTLRGDYATLRRGWGGDGLKGSEFQFWMENDINNAKLGAIGAYQTWVGSLTILLEQNNSFEAFVEQVRRLEDMTKGEREAYLLGL
ncbi:MAG: aminopeptidase [Pseudomonadales bacterium]|nr:aminopeptidase [Pseudomonadales bacterium]